MKTYLVGIDFRELRYRHDRVLLHVVEVVLDQRLQDDEAVAAEYVQLEEVQLLAREIAQHLRRLQPRLHAGLLGHFEHWLYPTDELIVRRNGEIRRQLAQHHASTGLLRLGDAGDAGLEPLIERHELAATSITLKLQHIGSGKIDSQR